MVTSTEASPPAAPRRLWPALLALTMASGAAGGSWWWFFLRDAGKAPPRAEKPADPVFFGLEPFTVNLQPQGRSRYLHVAISLKLSDDKVQALLLKHLPEVRSRVLSVLANRDADALMQPADKERLAEEVRSALEQPFGTHPPAQGVSQVMFTTFMLQ